MRSGALWAAAPILFAFGPITATHGSAIDRSSVALERLLPGIVSPAITDTAAQALYEKNCRKCHGPDGVPSKAMQKKFSRIETFDAAFFAKRSDDSLVTVLTKGTTKDMKSFKSKLSPAEMKAVAGYIRSFPK